MASVNGGSQLRKMCARSRMNLALINSYIAQHPVLQHFLSVISPWCLLSSVPELLRSVEHCWPTEGQVSVCKPPFLLFSFSYRRIPCHVSVSVCVCWNAVHIAPTRILASPCKLLVFSFCCLVAVFFAHTHTHTQSIDSKVVSFFLFCSFLFFSHCATTWLFSGQSVFKVHVLPPPPLLPTNT